jgi:hypothetical protein
MFFIEKSPVPNTRVGKEPDADRPSLYTHRMHREGNAFLIFQK